MSEGQPAPIRPVPFARVRRWARTSRLRLAPEGILAQVHAEAERRLDARELARVRQQRARDPEHPLVTVRIATYSRGPRIASTLDSCLEQDYPNIEIIVVGDDCDAATQDAVLAYRDKGVKFVNLGQRGQYPQEKERMWQVAGCTPMNVGAYVAAGSWIAPCDDDDTFTPDHVSSLLSFAQSRDAEMVWSDAAMQRTDGSWERTLGPPLAHGRISHGSVLYRSDLRFMQLNRRSHLLNEPADWNLWKRMRGAGVRIAYCPRLTYYHYL